MTEKFDDLPSQNVFNLGCVTFASNFDNGNLAKVKKIELGLPFEYRIWVAPDNQGKVCCYYHFLSYDINIYLCRKYDLIFS
jgi:hypothetical protein